MSWATYAGKQAIDKGGASFHLEPGPEPSRGTITMLSRDAATINNLTGSGEDLVFYDKDGVAATFKHIFIESISDADPGLVTLSLVDSRYSWKFRTGTWILNYTYDDNSTYNTKTINGSNPWSFSAIIQKFGTTLTNVPSGAFKPAINYSGKLDNINLVLKNINFECMSAAEAMQNCLSIVGGHVSIDMNGDIWINLPDDVAPGIELKNTFVTKYSYGDKINNILNNPKYLKLKYRTLREIKLTKHHWEPVMQYPSIGPNGEDYTGAAHGRGGEWGHVDDVLNQLGYSTDLIKKNYFNLANAMDVGKDKYKAAIMSLIQEQFYKYFRVKTPTTTSEDEREQLLPLHDTLATYSRKDANEKHKCPAYAEKTVGLYSPEQDGTDAIVKSYVDPFCVSYVDQNQGIIHFNVKLPVCDRGDAVSNGGNLKTDYQLGDLDINVWVSYIKKFVSSNGLTDDYYIPTNGASGTGYLDIWTGVGGSLETLEMLVEDVYYVEQNDGSGYTAINQSIIDTHSAQIAEDFFRGFKSKGRPLVVELCSFNHKIKHLYADMKYISYTVDPTNGGLCTLKYNDDTPVNPFSYNYIDEYGALQGVGNSYRLGAKTHLKRGMSGGGKFGLLPTSTPEAIKFAGLMSHCADYGKRAADTNTREAPTLINDWTKGLMVGEDWGNDADHRSKKCRVTGVNDFRPEYKFVAKTDDCYHHVRRVWETRLVAEENKRAKITPIGQPQITPVDTTAKQSTNPNIDTSGGGISQPVNPPISPAMPPNPTTSDSEGPGTSTYVWDRSNERGPSYKGPLNHVLQVGKHRASGNDPDGNHLARLEIDLEMAKHHYDDEHCGEMNHVLKQKKPQPMGIMNAVDMIFRDDIKRWDWVCYNSGGGIPPGTPTPGPTPTPPPGTPVPPPGEPPPNPPGGPVTTPEPGPTSPPAPGPSPSPGPPAGGDEGTGVKTTWGRKPPANPGNAINPDDPNVIPPAPIEYPPGTAPPPEPEPEFPDFPWPSTGVSGVDECRAVKSYREFGGFGTLRRPKLKEFTGGHASKPVHEYIPIRGDYRRALPWFDTPQNIYDYEWTPGGSYLADPYVPGSQVHATAVRPYARPNPYYPGTGSLTPAEENRFSLRGQPTTFDWTDHSGDRMTDKDYKLKPSIADGFKSAFDKINSISGRVEDLYDNQILNVNDGPGAPGTFITVDGKTITYNAGGQLTTVLP